GHRSRPRSDHGVLSQLRADRPVGSNARPGKRDLLVRKHRPFHRPASALSARTGPRTGGSLLVSRTSTIGPGIRRGDASALCRARLVKSYELVAPAGRFSIGCRTNSVTRGGDRMTARYWEPAGEAQLKWFLV